MNVNNFSVNSFDIDYHTPRNNRAKLDTGFHCNYKCEFCYYLNHLHLKTSFEKIKERIDYIQSYGITQIDLSGGESSIHKDWFSILDYCNSRFERISCLSNGSAFSNEKFLVQSKERGLREVLFSLHGYSEEVHDSIVGKLGAWKKIHAAIGHCKKHDLRVRINCTVYQKNYSGLERYAEIIKNIDPFEVNFLTLNHWDDSSTFEPIDDYTALTDGIKRCIDLIKDQIKLINVRYTPYCFMVGYEKYVCNQYQHIYDIYDWNKEIYDGKLDTSKNYTLEEKIDLAYEAAKVERLDTYKKPLSCIRCKYFNICDGIEKQSDTKVFPIRGKKIRDVNYYRKDFYN